MDIQAALKEMTDELMAGYAASEIIDMIAEDHGMNPVLLNRKFREQFGCTPEEYVDQQAARSEFTERTDASLEASALEKARKIALEHLLLHYRGEPDKRLFGKVVVVGANRFFMMGVVAGRPRWNALGVNLSTLSVHKLSLTQATINGLLTD